MAPTTSSDSDLEVFLEHACIFTAPTDLPVKWRRAARLLERRPELATASLHAAVLCGELAHVEGQLAEDPARVHAPGGPQGFAPLLFACYGRVPTPKAVENGLAMARLLLDAGADPDAHVVLGDWRLRFTALTGVMGQGEMGQPEHPQALALARLLLERGADPNDGQGLYDTHLMGDDTRWLELLFEFGLGPDDPVSWHADPADAPLSGVDPALPMLDYLLAGAAKNGHRRRLALLLAHGANPDARSIYDGKSCLHHALLAGDDEAAALLRRHGAGEVALTGHDAFVAAVRRGERARAAQLLEAHPESLERVEPLLDAAGRGDERTVALLLELGVDPNTPGPHGHRALNNACGHRAIAERLLAHGADPRARAFGGTACGWARHAGDLGMARFFAERSRSLLDAASAGHLELARSLLEADPACIHERSPEGNGPLHELALEPAVAEPLLALLLAHGADPQQRNDAGQTPAERLETLGADAVGTLLLELAGRGRAPR